MFINDKNVGTLKLMKNFFLPNYLCINNIAYTHFILVYACVLYCINAYGVYIHIKLYIQFILYKNTIS